MGMGKPVVPDKQVLWVWVWYHIWSTQAILHICAAVLWVGTAIHLTHVLLSIGAYPLHWKSCKTDVIPAWDWLLWAQPRTCSRLAPYMYGWAQLLLGVHHCCCCCCHPTEPYQPSFSLRMDGFLRYIFLIIVLGICCYLGIYKKILIIFFCFTWENKCGCVVACQSDMYKCLFIFKFLVVSPP